MWFVNSSPMKATIKLLLYVLIMTKPKIFKKLPHTNICKEKSGNLFKNRNAINSFKNYFIYFFLTARVAPMLRMTHLSFST